MSTLTTLANTITVKGHFGDKHINREDFAKQWVDHVMQARNLDWSPEWQDAMAEIIKTIRAKAEQQFDRLFIEENK